MILYTVIPYEIVLAGLGAETPAAPADSLTVDGIRTPGGSGPVRLLLNRDSDGRYRVSRLLSSDPFDFLNPAFAPGRVVDRPEG